ncbi:MAG: Metallopeptidase-like protein [Microgenomates group bacterium GW2011_GWC1_37_12b]|uniref:Metallopeptidase-like protein n=1 Tax=Candidatus Woesebacteria bacterium GW2011_GWB1_38_8b TaxID=1618571 RepID=A0A0G0L8N6_9BACT|nr:MAG: Metallopeptidase-like protein [Microgenomates group bacterium GW2011_GWC1_37_12b]KKQ87362.1 MAG: Metallopeptidase-like protein [Candidatus Woesebacteria bacterium GW2011_GWB1_38_8b]
MRKKNKPVVWENASDIKKLTENIIVEAKVSWVIKADIYYFRSYNSKARAYARIWGLGRVWQQALKIKPSYIIEVISERFDNLDISHKKEILSHELSHIPKNFSGSLIPHIKKRGKRNFHDKVTSIFSKLS